VPHCFRRSRRCRSGRTVSPVKHSDRRSAPVQLSVMGGRWGRAEWIGGHRWWPWLKSCATKSPRPPVLSSWSGRSLWRALHRRNHRLRRSFHPGVGCRRARRRHDRLRGGRRPRRRRGRSGTPGATRRDPPRAAAGIRRPRHPSLGHGRVRSRLGPGYEIVEVGVDIPFVGAQNRP